MGTRYYVDVTCECGATTENVYYAPTCGFTVHKCGCGREIDLGEYTGISYEDASNLAEIESVVASVRSQP